MISTCPATDSELGLDQNDDSHMAHDWIFNSEAIDCCPNNDRLIDFAGHKWGTNYHWSKQDGPYVWGGNNPNEPLFGTVVDPYLATIVYKRQIPLAIEPPNNTYKSWPTSEVCLMEKVAGVTSYVTHFPFINVILIKYS